METFIEEMKKEKIKTDKNGVETKRYYLSDNSLNLYVQQLERLKKEL